MDSVEISVRTSRLNCSKVSDFCFFLALRFSEIVKMTNRTAVNETPEMVAILLENKFASATKNNTSVVRIRPNGISRPPILKLPGVLYSWSCRWKRSTTTLNAFRKKLHMIPKAYASPSRYVWPRLSTTVINCKIVIKLMMRYVVPKRRCGFWNQGSSTPSSATRFITPLAPMMDVLTAPERINTPTITTKMWKASLSSSGPIRCVVRPPKRFST